MDRKIAQGGSLTVAVTVALFAVCMPAGFDFGSYFVCMLLPIGYILMTAGFCRECPADRKAAAYAGALFAAVYAVLVLLVYFAQVTTVRLEELDGQALRLLDFQKSSLLFYYDLLGYGMMALSTFFIGLTIQPACRADRWLKALMMLHGVFFLSCFLLPMTGIFSRGPDGGMAAGGTAALEVWCVYFFPIGVLSCRHFGRG